MDTILRDQLIAEKLPLAEATSLLGDAFLNTVKDRTRLLGNCLYLRRNIKLRSRIISKIERYQAENPQLSLHQAVDMVPDFAGGRLLGHSLSDVNSLYKNFNALVSNRNDIKLTGDCDNCIHTPRDTGFRAITQVILFRIKPRPVTWFPFEVQIMTFLAHDWDQKQHEIYEYREHMPESIHSMFRAMSYRLLEVDDSFERIRIIVSGFIPEEEKDK